MNCNLKFIRKPRLRICSRIKANLLDVLLIHSDNESIKNRCSSVISCRALIFLLSSIHKVQESLLNNHFAAPGTYDRGHSSMIRDTGENFQTCEFKQVRSATGHWFSYQWFFLLIEKISYVRKLSLNKRRFLNLSSPIIIIIKLIT